MIHYVKEYSNLLKIIKNIQEPKKKYNKKNKLNSQ